MGRTVVQQVGALGIGSRFNPAARRAQVRQKRRALLVETRSGDNGSPELQQHHRLAADVTVVGGIESPVKRVIDQRPIDRYRVQNQINQTQWQAADMFAGLAYRAGAIPRVISRYNDDPRHSGSTEDRISDRDVARRAYNMAIQALGTGSKLASIAQAVCVDEQHAHAWAIAHGSYAGAERAKVEGMVTLRLALDRLAQHWYLPVDTSRRS
jgi:hypothetical protein